MTLVFTIPSPERCQICHKPVREYIYQHQCRPNTQPTACLSCLSEKGTCRYCHSPFTVLKLANDTWNQQFYYERPARRRTGSIGVFYEKILDMDEAVRAVGLAETDAAYAKVYSTRNSLWNRPTPSSDFKGFIIDDGGDVKSEAVEALGVFEENSAGTGVSDVDEDDDDDDDATADSYLLSLFSFSRVIDGEDDEDDDEAPLPMIFPKLGHDHDEGEHVPMMNLKVPMY